MNLFRKITTKVREFFRPKKAAPDAAPPAPERPPITDARMESDLRAKLGSRRGCHGTSRGQKFNRLAAPLGLQMRGDGRPGIMLYNLKRAIPGHPAGSTVSRETVDHVVDYLERGGRLK